MCVETRARYAPPPPPPPASPSVRPGRPADLPEHTQQQLGYEAQWEAEKQRWAAEQQQRQAAAAVAQSEAAAAAPPAQAEAPAGVAAEPEPAAKPKRTPRRASSKEATVASGKARRAKGSRAAQSADGA